MCRALVAVVAGAGLVLALPAGADAISKARADATAQRAFAQQLRGDNDAILFGLGRRLRANESLGFATRTVETPPRQRIGRAAWVYWLDQQPYAQFEHPSILLVIDDRTGRVARRSTLRYYPVVNGTVAPWLGSPGAYEVRRYRVATRLGQGGGAATSTARVDRPRRSHKLGNIPKSDFANDCILFIGGVYDASRRRDFRAMEKFAESAGIRAFYATRSRGVKGAEPTIRRPRRRDLPRSATGITNSIRELEAKKPACTDIMIYANGDTRADKDERTNGSLRMSGPLTGAKGLPKPWYLAPRGPSGLSENLPDRFREPPTTFKLKVDAPRAALWVNAFSSKKMLVAEGSSGRNESSYRYIDPAALRPLLLKKLRAAGTPAAEIEPAIESAIAMQKKANPGKLSEFTNANIRGMTAYAKGSEAQTTATLGGSRLATMLARGAELGKPYNMAYMLMVAMPTQTNRVSRDKPLPPATE